MVNLVKRRPFTNFLPTNYYIQENICMGKLMCFEWKMAIRGKTLTVTFLTFLYAYIAYQQGDDSQEKICDSVKNCENYKSFLPWTFSHIQYFSYTQLYVYMQLIYQYFTPSKFFCVW